MGDLKVIRNSVSHAQTESEPLVELPAWWSGFLFHVLNPRQVSMLLYLIMLCDERGVCHPTIEQIRKNLGLLSTTMVFESIAVLEECGFFMRSRQLLPESRSRQNVYRRASCEYTVLRLLEMNSIDGRLHPLSAGDPQTAEAMHLAVRGLREILSGAEYESYAAATDEQRRDLLIALLSERLLLRRAGIYAYE